MITKVLGAVDDSPAGLAASRLAVDVARAYRARLLVVTVVSDGLLEAEIGAGPAGPGLHERRVTSGLAFLRHVARDAERAGVPIELRELESDDVGTAVLDEARAWGADLVVIGRSRRRHAGDPYIGGDARQVLEFAEQPVLVAPPPNRH